jgi:adhesin HecA-like repeat protein
MNLNGGYLFNTGIIATKADPSVLQNIAYLYNTGQIEATGKLVVGSDVFSNEGEFTAREAEIITSGTIQLGGKVTTNQMRLHSLGKVQLDGTVAATQDVSVESQSFANSEKGSVTARSIKMLIADSVINEGTIKGTASMDISAKSLVNSKMIEGASNTIIVPTLTNRGEIVGRGLLIITSDSFSNEGGILGNQGTTTIAGKIFEHKGGEFSGIKVTLKSGESFIRAPISGQELFLEGEVANETEVKFGKLELTGTRAHVKNSGKLTVERVVSSSNQGLITGDEATAREVETTKFLQLNQMKLPNLRTAKTSNTGKLLLLPTVEVPNLAAIDNFGNVLIQSKLTALPTITGTGKTTIEPTTAITGITKIDNMKGGQLAIKASFQNLTIVSVPKGASVMFLDGFSATSLRDLTVQAGGSFLSEQGANLRNVLRIKNFGTATFNSEMMKLEFLHNGRSADMHILDRVKAISSTEKAEVLNEGKILVRHKYRPGETEEYQDIEVKGKYIGTEGSVSRYENGAHTLCDDYINHGVLYSPTRFRIIQRGTVTKWGRAVAEDGIEYLIEGGQVDLDKSKIDLHSNKHSPITINSKEEFKVTTPTELPDSYEIVSPNFTVISPLKVKNLKVKTGHFSVTGYGKIDSSEYIQIDAHSFSNTSGKIQAMRDITFNISGNFTNTGGEQKGSKYISYSYYTQDLFPKYKGKFLF